MKRTQRMLVKQWELVRVLAGHNHRGVAPARLMEALGVARATVYRYIALLRAAGVPIDQHTTNGEVRFRLGYALDLPALGLTPLQVTALHLARAELEPLAGTGLVSALDELLAKLRPPERQRAFRFPEPAPGRPDVLRAIEQSLRSRRRLRLEYRAASRAGRASVVHVEPLLVSVAEREPYLRAFCVERAEERTYKIARITSATLTDQRSAHKPPRRAGTNDPYRHSVKAWTGELVVARVRLGPDVGWRAGEYPLVADQKVVSARDGGVVVEGRVAGLVEVARWVVAWGDAAEALEPPELRELVSTELRRALRPYGGPEGGPGVRSGGTAEGRSRRLADRETRRA